MNTTRADYSIRPAAVGFTVTHEPSGIADVFDLRSTCERWIDRHAQMWTAPVSVVVSEAMKARTGLTIGKAEAMGLDDTDGAWCVVCEDHGTIINVRTRKDARTVSGIDFCDGCRDADTDGAGEQYNTSASEAAEELIRLWMLGGMTREAAIKDLRKHYAREIADAEAEGNDTDATRLREIRSAL